MECVSVVGIKKLDDRIDGLVDAMGVLKGRVALSVDKGECDTQSDPTHDVLRTCLNIMFILTKVEWYWMRTVPQ